MIRINLLKNTARKRSKAEIKVSPKVIIIAILAIVIGIGGFIGSKYLPKAEIKKKHEPVVVTPPAPPPVPVRSGPNMIEEVVKEVGETRNEPPKLNIPYSEMTFLEKVNYEVLFGRSVFQALSKAIPPGIGLRMLEVDNFISIYATGIGDTKELISSTFTALKDENFELLPKPHSYITANGNRGFKFVVTCKADLGIDHADPFQPWEHIGTRDDIPFILKRISDVAQANTLSLSKKPSQISSEDIGLYRRCIYNYKGKGDYKSFVSFILGLYNEKIPCSFKKVILKAGNGTAIDIEIELLLTLKE
jgi:hypothetical protein